MTERDKGKASGWKVRSKNSNARNVQEETKAEGREKADRKGREYRGTKVRATTSSSSGKSAGRMEQEGIRESKTEGCAGGCEKERNKSAPSVKVIS